MKGGNYGGFQPTGKALNPAAQQKGSFIYQYQQQVDCCCQPVSVILNSLK